MYLNHHFFKFTLFCLIIASLLGCSQSAPPATAPPTAAPSTAAAAEEVAPAAEVTKTPAEALETAPTEESDSAESGRAGVELPQRLLPRPRGLEYGYVDLAGEWVIEPQFEDALEFAEGLAAARVDGLYGYIDQSGQWVIEPQFNSAQNFSEGLAAVLQEQQWGYIDPSGQWVIEPQFEFANAFSEGLADVVLNQRIGFINLTGEMVITPQSFDFVQPFAEGLAVFGFEGLSGYLDKSGTFAIQPQYTFADNFSEGLAVVELEAKSGFIDPSGAFVIEPQYEFARSFSEGLAAVVVDGQIGYIDPMGDMVIEPQFNVGFDFSEGLAAVLVGEVWGYIDPTGEMIIEPQFGLAGDFQDGLAGVAFDENRPAYIDPTGAVVVEVKPAEQVTVETAIDLTPEQVSFEHDPSLAAEISSEITPGQTTLSPDIPYFALYPEHLAFTFVDAEALAQAGYEQGTVVGAQPKLLIYPVTEYEKVVPFVGEQIQALRELLAGRPETVAFEIPVLPLINAAQVFHPQIDYLDFQGGSGVRFVTQYAQDPRPVTNAELFYTFQGLSDDGQYYVAFYYPVSTLILPNTAQDTSAAADYEAFLQNLNTYMPETIQRLDALAAEDYAPDLRLLDSVITSLSLGAEGSGAPQQAEEETAEAADSPTPVGRWTVSTYKLGGLSAWGKEEAETLLDKVAEFSADSITFDGQSCQDVLFASDMAGAVDYFEVNYRILPGVIGVNQDELEIITTDCDLAGFEAFMRLDNGQLVVNIEGVFFFLDKS